MRVDVIGAIFVFGALLLRAGFNTGNEFFSRFATRLRMKIAKTTNTRPFINHPIISRAGIFSFFRH
jgi:hypothetical protein